MTTATLVTLCFVLVSACRGFPFECGATQGPLARFGFDTETGLGADSVAHQNHANATLRAMRGSSGTLLPQFVENTTDAPVGAGYVRFLSGNPSAIDFGAWPEANIGTGSFSVASWIRVAEGVNLHQRVVTHGPTADNNGFSLMQWNAWGNITGGAMAFLVVVEGFGEAAIATHGPMGDGQWHHYAAIFDRVSKRMRLFVDGSEIVAPSGAIMQHGAMSWGPGGIGDISSWDPSFNISSECNFCMGLVCSVGDTCDFDSEPFQGDADEVAIFNRNLGAEEIAALANGSVACQEARSSAFISSSSASSSSSSSSSASIVTITVNFDIDVADPEGLANEIATVLGIDASLVTVVVVSGGMVEVSIIGGGEPAQDLVDIVNNKLCL